MYVALIATSVMAKDNSLLNSSRNGETRIDIIPKGQSEGSKNTAKHIRVNLSFEDLKYTVKQGKGECFFFHHFKCFHFAWVEHVKRDNDVSDPNVTSQFENKEGHEVHIFLVIRFRSLLGKLTTEFWLNWKEIIVCMYVCRNK